MIFVINKIDENKNYSWYLRVCDFCWLYKVNIKQEKLFQNNFWENLKNVRCSINHFAWAIFCFYAALFRKWSCKFVFLLLLPYYEMEDRFFFKCWQFEKTEIMCRSGAAKSIDNNLHGQNLWLYFDFENPLLDFQATDINGSISLTLIKMFE